MNFDSTKVFLYKRIWPVKVQIVSITIFSFLLVNILRPYKNEDPWNVATRNAVLNGKVCKDFGIKASFPYNPDRSFRVNVDDIFLAIKTTFKNENRSDLIHQTWFNQAPKETYIVTDLATPKMKEQFGENLLETECAHTYRGEGGLQCKTKIEFTRFIKMSNKKWFCNLDDDIYVNSPRLAELLQCFNPKEEWYLGSISRPFKMYHLADGIERKYRFGHGQMYCMSRLSIIKILTIFGNVPFHKLNALYDDIIIGYINELVLNTKLTYIKMIYHHGLYLEALREAHLPYVVSFSYSFRRNTFVNVSGFPRSEDPTRVRSAHCHLYPKSENCPKKYFSKYAS